MIALHDADIMPAADLAALVRGARWQRLAVLGDSVAEGVREPLDGYRDLSWIDRIAEPLRAAVPELAVLNLGRRNLLAGEVRASQLEAALAFRPDLAIVSAGGNDSLRRSFSPDAVERELDAIVGPLRRAGADVLMLEPMNIVASGLVPAEHAGPLDERMRRLAELTRTVARRHGAILVEMRRQPASAVPGVYARDRLPPQRARARDRGKRGRPRAELGDPGEGRGMMDLRIDITEAEILADLTWPGPPPGHWPVRSGASPAYEKQEPGADQGRRANSSLSASSPRAVSASPG